jgi:hypothetical protein
MPPNKESGNKLCHISCVCSEYQDNFVMCDKSLQAITIKRLTLNETINLLRQI